MAEVKKIKLEVLSIQDLWYKFDRNVTKIRKKNQEYQKKDEEIPIEDFYLAKYYGNNLDSIEPGERSSTPLASKPTQTSYTKDLTSEDKAAEKKTAREQLTKFRQPIGIHNQQVTATVQQLSSAVVCTQPRATVRLRS